MIFNDLFDMPIDKINHPNRPLIRGDVSVRQALWYAAFFVTGTEYIAQFMNPLMRTYIRCALMGVILYTPVLKRIPLVKNIFCASLVSMALWFSGNAENFSPILACATQHIFAGSLHNELLLDIRDKQGDAQHKIATIPVLFGNTVSWYLAMNVLVINLLRLAYVLTWQKTLPLLLICLPMFRNLLAIPIHNYNRDVVVKASKDTSTPLFLSLLYFIILARK
jgi:geranylgeranylglycerol-phosphate geranylgeranyltransferase